MNDNLPMFGGRGELTTRFTMAAGGGAKLLGVRKTDSIWKPVYHTSSSVSTSADWETFFDFFSFLFFFSSYSWSGLGGGEMNLSGN